MSQHTPRLFTTRDAPVASAPRTAAATSARAIRAGGRGADGRSSGTRCSAATAPATPTAGEPTAVLGSGGAAASDWYELYFTQPVYPDRPENHHGGLDEKLVAFIGTARQTIDAADYDFDLENVAQALAAARKRGVRVRFVTDTDTWTSQDAAVQRAWSTLKQADVPVV